MCRQDIGSVKYNLERFFQMTGWVGFDFGFFVVVLGFFFFSRKKYGAILC